MLWFGHACIAKGKKGPLVVLECPGRKGGGVDAKQYISQVLKLHLMTFYSEMKQKKKGIPLFQQDGAPCHKGDTQKWLASHDIPLFPHPPPSPDVSPIEPLWYDLKERIRQLPHRSTSRKTLIEAVKIA